MICDTQESILRAFLELRALDPLAKLTSAKADLLELFQLYFFDSIGIVLFLLAKSSGVAATLHQIARLILSATSGRAGLSLLVCIVVGV